MADSAGASPGTVAGNVTLGQAGALADGTTAMRFDGADATRVTIPASAALTAIDGANAITMEAWVNPQTLTLPEHFRMFYSFPGSPASYLGLNDGSGSARVILALKFNGVQRTIPGGPSLAVGAWTHVVATYDGTRLTLYENGSLVGQMTGLSGPITIGTQGVRLGGHPITGHQVQLRRAGRRGRDLQLRPERGAGRGALCAADGRGHSGRAPAGGKRSGRR